MRAAVVDLFCGIGGLSYGFKQEGFDVRAGVDSDVSCEFAFEHNLGAPFFGTDIRKFSAAALKRLLQTDRGYRVLIGSAPCAPFSLYPRRYRKAKKPDRARRWALL